MSSISKAGIFIDVKQLLEFTHRMVKEMDNADRRHYGDALVRYNLEMISNFTMAFHRRDERVSFEVVRSRERGLRNYVDSINSYLGMIKSTSDLRLAKELIDAVSRPGVEKDYDNYKLKIVEHQNKSKWIGHKS